MIKGIKFQAAIAQQLLPAVLSSEAVLRAMRDDDDKPSPNRIASLACDIANALYNEIERREWFIKDEPTPP